MQPPLLPRTLCLAGPDGAGKTTQAERLAERLRAEGHDVRLVTIWDLFDQAAPGAMPFGSKRDIDRFLAGLHPDGRAMFLHSAMREALDRALDDRGDAILIVVGYWIKYHATEAAYGASASLLEALAAAFPPLELNIFIDLDPATALARKPVVSGYESRRLGAAGFEAFQCEVRVPLEAALARGTWHRVDGAASIDAVEAAVAALVAPVAAGWAGAPHP